MSQQLHLPFSDRAEAGRLLGAELKARDWPANTVVLALPRGGVSVAFEAAAAIGAPLDVEVVRKLGVPWQPELAMGALAGGQVWLDEHLIAQLRISQDEVDAVIACEATEAARREALYRGNRPAPDLTGRTVILVDDGLATGASMRAAIHHVKVMDACAIAVAVPVASRAACRELGTLAGDCICLATPEPFFSVGAWYRDFTQVTDAEVAELLQKSRSVPAPPPCMPELNA